MLSVCVCVCEENGTHPPVGLTSCLYFSEESCDRNLDNLIESLSAMETLGTETRRKPQTAGERDGREESDCSMPSLEEEHEGRVGRATEHNKEMKEENDEDEDVGVATEEYDEDSYNEEQGGNMDEDEGVAEMCPNDLGAGLRKRNRHD